jgi:hypothetical protein
MACWFKAVKPADLCQLVLLESASNVPSYGSQSVTSQPDKTPCDCAERRETCLVKTAVQSCPAQPHTNMDKFKKINWINIAVIAVVSVIVVKVVYPLVQPTLAKLPVVGGYFTA